jgi:predicted restriction endonuclease
MTRDDVIAAFNAIRVWQSGDRRAVHKPLLVFYEALKADPELIAIVAHRIVDAHFPESIRGDVLDAVGLTLIELTGSARDQQRRRDPAFRAKVLMAYQ